MSTQDYRPPRKSAVFEDNGVSNEIAGDDPGAQLQPAAPPAHGGRRPMPKPRNPKPLPPMGPAPTPHFVEPGPYLQDPAGPAPTPQQLRGDGQALPPHVIGHNPPLPGTAPPLYNYQQPGGPPPPPYQLQPGAPANPLERSGVGAQNEKKRGPADFRVRVQGSYMFCTTWRGIIEIIARAAVMVVAVVSFILSPIHIRTIQSNQYLDLILMVQATTSPIPETQALIRDSANVAGFMIFLSIVCFIIQIPTIVGRFILKGGTALIFVLHLVDAVASGVLAVFFLSGAIAAGSYGGQWGEPPQICTEGFIDQVKEILSQLGVSSSGITFSCNEDTLAGQLGGLSVIGFAGGGLTIFLAVWTVYALYAKWDYASNVYKEDMEANVNGN